MFTVLSAMKHTKDQKLARIVRTDLVDDDVR
jgi:hypothetical protein